jgi:hypothetical protein
MDRTALAHREAQADQFAVDAAVACGARELGSLGYPPGRFLVRLPAYALTTPGGEAAWLLRVRRS